MYLFWLIGCLLALTSNFVEARQIHKERSIYRNVVIIEKDDVRCMRFETRRKKIANQACIDLKQPDRLVFEYAHGVLAGYAIKPKPERILIIGLGGGVLSNVMHQISPNAEIVSVEIDPVVVKLAKQYFNYQENDQVKTVIKDGRVYVKRALLNKEKFDWIILDAFNGDYIPEHLMTQEFLTEVKGLLTENGILSANTFSNSLLYDYESVTYQSVYAQLQIFQSPTKGNRVIFACNCNDFTQFPKASEELMQRLKKYQVDSAQVFSRISNKVNWNTESQVLTDQYSPANLLKQ
ncbi:spermidine synthase [Aliikangiella maris]|uniref:Fused MFS/spermidine synthase n=2 Tax=Aliikangiella maris TaxID=3162458 RepID=A0ABV3MUD1_9GAMM